MQKLLLVLLIALCAIAWTWRLERARSVDPELGVSESSELAPPPAQSAQSSQSTQWAQPVPEAGETRERTEVPEAIEAPATAEVSRPMHALADAAPAGRFTCDGRQYCSQMTSCEEATYFLQHCPDPKMDGDHDGIPCERQWCTGR
jgi:hypothetical protein